MSRNNRDRSFSELEERTLVVKNLDPRYVDKELLTELFANFGPVRNIVLKSDFAFVEYDHKVSVGYAFAMLTDICLHGRRLNIYPKIQNDPFYYEYKRYLNDFEKQSEQNPDFLNQFLTKKHQSQRKQMQNDVDKSHRKRNQIRDRIDAYGRHYCGSERDADINPYFRNGLMGSHRHRERHPQDHHRQPFHHSAPPDGPPVWSQPPPPRPPPGPYHGPGPMFNGPPPQPPAPGYFNEQYERPPPFQHHDDHPRFYNAPPPPPFQYDRPPAPHPEPRPFYNGPPPPAQPPRFNNDARNHHHRW